MTRDLWHFGSWVGPLVLALGAGCAEVGIDSAEGPCERTFGVHGTVVLQRFDGDEQPTCTGEYTARLTKLDTGS